MASWRSAVIRMRDALTGVRGIQASLERLHTQLEDMQADRLTLHSRIHSSLQSETAAIHQQIAALRQDWDADRDRLDDRSTAFCDDVVALRDRVSEMQALLTALETQATGIATRVQSLQTTDPDVRRSLIATDRLTRATEALIAELATMRAPRKGRPHKNSTQTTRPTLLFLHIPKTGGTSLDTGFLQNMFSKEQRLCETDLFHENQLIHRHVFAEMEHFAKAFGFPYGDVFRLFQDHGFVPRGLSYYAGHIAFGAHDAFTSPCLYITLIREPVARVVSQYRLLHSLNVFPGSLADFIDSGRQEVDNYQTRCLTRRGWNSQTVSMAALDEAKSNLCDHMLFSVTERIDFLFTQLKHRFGWQTPEITPELNRAEIGAPIPCGGGNRFRDIMDQVRQEDLARLAEMNALDTELYRFARHRAEEGFMEHTASPSVTTEASLASTIPSSPPPA